MPSLRQRQSIKQGLSPQQIVQATILQMNITNLEERVWSELESNPVLEQLEQADEVSTPDSESEVDFEEDPDEYEPANIYDNRKSFNEDIPVADQSNFLQDLVKQFNEYGLDEWRQAIAEEIIWNLDERGYLSIDIDLISDRFEATFNDVELILKKVQKLEPPGIAARNLQECLLIQLNPSTQDIHRRIITNYFDDFVNHRYERLQGLLAINKNMLKEVIKEISLLNPNPGNGKIHIENETVIPDLLAINSEGKWKVMINDDWIPELGLSGHYLNMAKQKSLAGDTQKFLKNKFDSATWFIQAIIQRRSTLKLVMKSIIKYQANFFQGEIDILKPMRLKDIADDIEMDISTISRSTRGKYVDTPYGIFELKFFFSDKYSLSNGQEISTKVIKDLLKDLIKEENKDKPLTDIDLSRKMKKNGFPIARRTVTKYREQLQFPVARLRRQIIH